MQPAEDRNRCDTPPVRRLRSSGRGICSIPCALGYFCYLVAHNSPAVQALNAKITALASTKTTVLIVGESGTGKELVARAIHRASVLSAPFVALNCAAIPKDLIESELFGYVKGAFSGASQDQLGLFRSAHGGTLFLDEITEMSAETQAKLLRAIQERCIRPVGATRETPIDLRIIASTNRDPATAIREGHLRMLRRDLIVARIDLDEQYAFADDAVVVLRWTYADGFRRSRPVRNLRADPRSQPFNKSHESHDDFLTGIWSS